MKSFTELPDYKDLRTLWKQEPVSPPVPDLELTPDHWVERGAEVIGWSLAQLEHWISASGWLRAWLRMNLFLSIVLTSAGVLLLPPVAQVLEQLARSSHWIGAILGEVFKLVTGLPPVVISLGILYLTFLLARWLIRRRSGRRGEGYY
jgi:hypothetical protein